MTEAQYGVFTSWVPRGDVVHVRERYRQQSRFLDRALCGADPMAGWRTPWAAWRTRPCRRCIAVIVRRWAGR